MPYESAVEKPKAAAPIVSQSPSVAAAIISITGTKKLEILSASACIGALDPSASSTILMM
jgi:hypothetical protein